MRVARHAEGARPAVPGPRPDAAAAEPPPVSVQAVAEAEGLSPEYAAKLLRMLRLGGLVRSTRGAAGGYRLARPAGEIRVWEAVSVLGGELFPEEFCRCHAGRSADGAPRRVCVREDDCALRALWRTLGARVREELERITLADLCRGELALQARLARVADPATDREEGGARSCRP